MGLEQEGLGPVYTTTIGGKEEHFALRKTETKPLESQPASQSKNSSQGTAHLLKYDIVENLKNYKLDKDSSPGTRKTRKNNANFGKVSLAHANGLDKNAYKNYKVDISDAGTTTIPKMNNLDINNIKMKVQNIKSTTVGIANKVSGPFDILNIYKSSQKLYNKDLSTAETAREAIKISCASANLINIAHGVVKGKQIMGRVASTSLSALTSTIQAYEFQTKGAQTLMDFGYAVDEATRATNTLVEGKMMEMPLSDRHLSHEEYAPKSKIEQLQEKYPSLNIDVFYSDDQVKAQEKKAEDAARNVIDKYNKVDF